MIHEQIAQDVFDKLERERGVFHYNDKEELIRRFAQALLDAETRGLANGTLCTVPAKDLPYGKPRLVSDEERAQWATQLTETVACYTGFIIGFKKAEELRATRDVEAAWPTLERIKEFLMPAPTCQVQWDDWDSGFIEGIAWLKSELLARLGGNKK